jgi:hypothetical protein
MQFTIVGLLALGAGPAAAQGGQPTGAQLHARFVEAIGGKATLQRVTSRRVYARFEVASQGMSGPVEIVAAAPSKLLVRTEIPGMGVSLSGYDGEVAWTMNPAMGPQLLDGMALEQLKQQADIHAELHPEKYIASRTTTGEAEYEGKKCWNVTVKTHTGETYSECYDKDNGLLLAAVRKTASPMGEMETTTIFVEYKAFDGIKIPSVVKASAMGFTQLVTVDSVSTRPIPDSVFALPPEVKALKK